MSDDWRLVVQYRAAPVAPVPTIAELSRKLETSRPRPKGPSWLTVLYRAERRMFDSRWVSLEIKTERGAHWLAHLVRTAVEADVFAAPKGANVRLSHREPITWTHHTPGKDDDCVCRLGPFGAHVENMRGPYGKGGEYYVGTWREEPGKPSLDLVDYHAVLPHIEVRSGEAGRFLAELAIDLARSGAAIPSIEESLFGR
jgi:hypothetical protein